MGQWGIFAGALGDDLMDRKTQRLGIGKNVSFGNMMDLDEVDFLEYCAQDSGTSLIGVHAEAMRRPEQFFSLAREVVLSKPVLLLKSGRTAQGADAASRHTGEPATDEELVRKGVAESGVIRAANLDDFLGFLLGFSRQPLPPGGRVAVLSYSGGSNVLAVDELTEAGLTVANLKKTHGEALAAVLDDPGVDSVLYILCAVPNSDFEGVGETFREATAGHPEKPVFLVAMGGETKRAWMTELDDVRLPVYPTTSLPLKTLGAMHDLAAFRRKVETGS
jgi:acetyltransferase